MTELPDCWRNACLDDIAQVTLGQSPPGDTYNSDGRGAPFFQGKSEFTATYAEVRKYTTAGAKFAIEGDILISVRAPVGPTNIAPVDCAIGRGLAGLRAMEGLDQRYLLWALRATEHELASQGAGSTFAAVTGKQLKAHRINVAPLDEQRRIVDILEDHLSRLDAADQSLADAHHRSGLLRAVTLEWLAPKNSALRTLGQLATDSGYGTSTKCVVDGPGVPVVRIPNLIGGRIDLADEKRVADATVDLTRLMLHPDDLLIVRTNGSRDLIGRAAVVQSAVFASFASYLIRFRLDPSQIRPQWTRVMLGTPSVRRVLEAMAASSAGQYNLGLKKLNGVAIPCPPMEDQDRLLASFDEQEWALGSLTRSLAERRVKAQSLRRSLLAAAFSGRLTGHSSDMEMVEEMAGV
jgi:type I restriction enzyme, S subunit